RRARGPVRRMRLQARAGSSRRLRRLGCRSLLGWCRGLRGWCRGLLGWGGLIAAASLLGARAGGAIVHARERKARLDLVGGESILLLLELTSGEPRQKHTLFLLGGVEARLQGVDALLEGGDAGRELPGVGRHVFTVALHADPAALCLVQCETEILQPAMLLPQARVEGVAQAKLQYPLDQRQSHAQVRVLGCVGSRGERRLHTLHARP